jgi:hypothetical protein
MWPRFATADLADADNRWTVTIPADLAPGQYLVRHELMALHLAYDREHPAALSPPLTPMKWAKRSCMCPSNQAFAARADPKGQLPELHSTQRAFERQGRTDGLGGISRRICRHRPWHPLQSLYVLPCYTADLDSRLPQMDPTALFETCQTPTMSSVRSEQPSKCLRSCRAQLVRQSTSPSPSRHCPLSRTTMRPHRKRPNRQAKRPRLRLKPIRSRTDRALQPSASTLRHHLCHPAT